MSTISNLKAVVDKLPPDEFIELYEYIQHHVRATQTWGVVPAENLMALGKVMRSVQDQAANMRDEEIDEVIHQALVEVRRGRKTKGRD